MTFYYDGFKKRKLIFIKIKKVITKVVTFAL
jgi:hypothetical protein